MAILDDTNRSRVWAQWMRENVEPCAFAKGDVRLAVNSIDDYLDGMQLTRPATSLRAAVLAAAPNFVNNASAEQQKQLLAMVMMRRAGRLFVQGD